MDLILKDGDEEYLVARNVSKDSLSRTDDFLGMINNVFEVVEHVDRETWPRVI